MTAPLTENPQPHRDTSWRTPSSTTPRPGIYRANRRIFTDEEVFELEMKHIFEGNWIYLAHESQVPNPGDYFTTYIGRQPVVITRDKNGSCTVSSTPAPTVAR